MIATLRSSSPLERLGLVGLASIEAPVIAALATESPMLLIGPHGTAKSLLLTRIADALGLESRHYNASLLSFDDLIGFPLPGQDGSLQYVRTPASVWGAGAVIFDEISRCRPDMQNKLFPIIHERRVQGMPLDGLRHRWAAMNPPAVGDADPAYVGSEPLDAALADRFPFVVQMPSWDRFTEAEQLSVIRSRDLAVAPEDAQRIQDRIARTQAIMQSQDDAFLERASRYVRVVGALLAQAGLPLSPRRSSMLWRSVRAVTAALHADDPQAPASDAALIALQAGIPHRAQGIAVSDVALLSAHREAMHATAIDADPSMSAILCTADPLERLRLLLRLRAPDSGALSGMVADVMAQLPEGARDAAAVALCESGMVGHLNAAVAAEIGERYAHVAAPRPFQQRISATDGRFAAWSRIKDLLATLDPKDARAQLRGNALVAGFVLKRIGSADDASRAFEAYAHADGRLRS